MSIDYEQFICPAIHASLGVMNKHVIIRKI